jgi:ADP-heptose:LPS heptosyltransferase
MQSKIWSTEDFVEIGRRLLSNGRVEIAVVGGIEDRSLAEHLISSWGEGLNCAGTFSVLGSAALLGRCRLTIAVDSGPMHLSYAVGTPCIALFSARDHPGRWDPLGTGNIVIRKSVACAGCMLTRCNVEGHPCMRGISVDEVWAAAQTSLLADPARGIGKGPLASC